MLPVLHLGCGKAFGELALQFDPEHPTRTVKRQASTFCLEDTKLIMIEKTQYV